MPRERSGQTRPGPDVERLTDIIARGGEERLSREVRNVRTKVEGDVWRLVEEAMDYCIQRWRGAEQVKGDKIR